ncbi:hypothetical protein D0T50_11220 [Bacteroides sp. 214]|uniref:winged helix-turn-helix domain-containing protein n=1 Tax=Bacteroides sp. 214 TaxID=2302935 RepID=UPI0013D6FC2D|nr:winged helix-turn-helix domain-containing protein [Bacteroides sp. 214]NDW13460.1 hypothetical protein [Bacteroides sp. 214]
MNKNEIASHAENVRALLRINSRLSYQELKHKSGLKEEEFGAALGWLAHEARIELEELEDCLYVYLPVNVFIG